MRNGTIDVERLREWLEAGRAVTLLDVRPRAEWEEWRIPGSLHVDVYDALKANDTRPIEALALPPGIPVVTICAAGHTSRIAADALRGRGYEVLSLEGGMRAWSTAWNLASLVTEGGGTKIVQVRRTGKGCLSYIVGSGREAVVIDPSVRPEVYEKLAEREGWKIVSAVDTHLHADHLSRARAVAVRTGAVLRLPARAAVDYSFEPIREGEEIRAGDSRIVPLDLPGHTVESTGYLVAGRVLLTGDTLFLSSVGRPDLLGDGETLVRQAGQLHRSLRKVLSLDPGVTVLPAHSSEPIAFDGRLHGAPLGEIRSRVRLLDASEDEFLAAIRSRIPPPPPNHEVITMQNRLGREPEGEDGAELEAGANRCAMP